MDARKLIVQLNWFIEQMNTKYKDTIELSYKDGKKYFKIIGYNAGVWGFIDKSNGDVLMAKNWSSPAKHARGNVFDADILSKVDWTGPRYLR